MSWKYALKAYVTNPETVDDGAMICFDDKVSIIRDAFAKSECHLLVLPRSTQLSRGHPTNIIDSKFKNEFEPVSYTHLDVYKRQHQGNPDLVTCSTSTSDCVNVSAARD